MIDWIILAELYSSPIDESSPSISPSDQLRNRVLTALRFVAEERDENFCLNI